MGAFFICGCLPSRDKLKEEERLTIKDTTMYLSVRNNFSLRVTGRIDMKISSIAQGKKSKLSVSIKNMHTFDIWVSENNLTETKDSTLFVNYSPDLSLLSPLHFREIKSRKSILFEIDYASCAHKLELALCFMHHPKFLNSTKAIHQAEKFVKHKNHLVMPLSLLTKENSFLFYMKNFPLDDEERVAEIQIIK